MKRPYDEAKQELKAILDLPLANTAIAVLIAHFTKDELAQLAVFIILLAIILTRKHDSRIPIAFALVLLMVSAFQLAFTTETAANNTAILAYYLLCTGVIAQFIEYIRNPEDDVIEEKEDESSKFPDIPKDLRHESNQVNNTAKYITSMLKDIIGKLKRFIEDAIFALKGKLSAKKEIHKTEKIQTGLYKPKQDYTPQKTDELDKKLEQIKARLMARDKKSYR